MTRGAKRGRGAKSGGRARSSTSTTRSAANVTSTNRFPTTTTTGASTSARQVTPEFDLSEFASVNPPPSPAQLTDAFPFDWTKWTTTWDLDDQLKVETPKKNADAAAKIKSISPFKAPDLSPFPESSWLQDIFTSSGKLRDVPPMPESPLQDLDSVYRNKRARPEADEDDNCEEEDEVEAKLKKMRTSGSSGKSVSDTDESAERSVKGGAASSASTSSTTPPLDDKKKDSGSSNAPATEDEENAKESAATADVASDADEPNGGDSDDAKEAGHVESATTSSANESTPTPPLSANASSGSSNSRTTGDEETAEPSATVPDVSPEVTNITGNDDDPNKVVDNTTNDHNNHEATDLTGNDDDTNEVVDASGDLERDDRVYLYHPFPNAIPVASEGSQSPATTATTSSNLVSSASTPLTTPSPGQGYLEAGSYSEPRPWTTKSYWDATAGDIQFQGGVEQTNGLYDVSNDAQVMYNVSSLDSYDAFAQSVPVTQFAPDPNSNSYPYDPIPQQYGPPNVGPQMPMAYPPLQQPNPGQYHHSQVPRHVNLYYDMRNGAYPDDPVAGNYVQAQLPVLSTQQYPAPQQYAAPLGQYPPQHGVMAYQEPHHPASQQYPAPPLSQYPGHQYGMMPHPQPAYGAPQQHTTVHPDQYPPPQPPVMAHQQPVRVVPQQRSALPLGQNHQQQYPIMAYPQPIRSTPQGMQPRPPLLQIQLNEAKASTPIPRTTAAAAAGSGPPSGSSEFKTRGFETRVHNADGSVDTVETNNRPRVNLPNYIRGSGATPTPPLSADTIALATQRLQAVDFEIKQFAPPVYDDEDNGQPSGHKRGTSNGSARGRGTGKRSRGGKSAK